jgi:hypothetical protein
MRAMRSGGEAVEAGGEKCKKFPQVAADRAMTIAVVLRIA